MPAPLPSLPAVIAHRGASGRAPENTLESLRAAHADGARWVEFDVMLSQDNVPVLFHDDEVARTTDGHGAVAALTYDMLRGLDAGAWFDAAFAGARVPNLHEAIALLGALGLGANIEIKPSPGREAETARVVCALLRKEWPDALPPPLLSSFAHRALTVARDVTPDWPRGWLVETAPADWQGQLTELGCATLHGSAAHVTDALIGACRAAEVPLLVYTVNDAARGRALLDAGVSALFTDYPARFAADAGAVKPD